MHCTCIFKNMAQNVDFRTISFPITVPANNFRRKETLVQYWSIKFCTLICVLNYVRRLAYGSHRFTFRCTVYCFLLLVSVNASDYLSVCLLGHFCRVLSVARARTHGLLLIVVGKRGIDLPRWLPPPSSDLLLPLRATIFKYDM